MKRPSTSLRSTDTDRILRRIDRFCARTLWILLGLAAMLINARLDGIADGITVHVGQGIDRPLQRPTVEDGHNQNGENAHAQVAP